MRSGAHAGTQVVRLIAGRATTPFRYRDKGTAAVIGRAAAIIELPFGIRLTGVLAWLGWVGLHIVMLLGNRDRLSTLVNLGWRYLARPQGREVVLADLPDRYPASATSAGAG
jgi:NADH dehydrogenase